MPGFVLTKGANLRFTEEQIEVVKSFFDQKDLTSFSFTEENLTDFAKLIIQLTTGGEPITFKEGEDMADLFEHKPKRLYASRANVETFVRRVIDELTPAVPPNYELGFRFHLGKTTSSNETYHAVIVPVCSPRPSNGAPYDHYADQENRLFTRAGVEWFGLSLTDWNDGINGEIIDKQRAMARISVSDAGRGSTVVYFSFSAFQSFIANLQGTYAWLSIKLCRTLPGQSGQPHDPTLHNRLSVLFMFLDSNEDIIIYRNGILNAGSIYFDRGDLIPPPYPDDDDSDIDPKP